MRRHEQKRAPIRPGFRDLLKGIHITRAALASALGLVGRTLDGYLDGEHTVPIGVGEQVAENAGVGRREVIDTPPEPAGFHEVVLPLVDRLNHQKAKHLREALARFGSLGRNIHLNRMPDLGFAHHWKSDGTYRHKYVEFVIETDEAATTPAEFIISVTVGSPEDGTFLVRYDYGKIVVDREKGDARLASLWIALNGRASLTPEGAARVWTWVGKYRAEFWVASSQRFTLRVKPGVSEVEPAGSDAESILIFPRLERHVEEAREDGHMVQGGCRSSPVPSKSAPKVPGRT